MEGTMQRLRLLQRSRVLGTDCNRLGRRQRPLIEHIDDINLDRARLCVGEPDC